MKPSERIHAIAQEQQAARVAHDSSYVLDAAAIVAYLDEQSAPRVGVTSGAHLRAIPCTDRLPPNGCRVLFFAPKFSEVSEHRWRVGYWEGGSDGPAWWDDASHVGDDTITHAVETVTHWRPMPGDPI